MDDSNNRVLTSSGIYYYKTAKFQENAADTNPFIKLSLLRRVACQASKLSYLLADNETSCDILNENLKNYSDLVDCKSGVNNYAESIQSHVKYFKNAQCQKWKSRLISDVEVKKSSDLPLVVPTNCSDCENRDDVNDSIELLRKRYKDVAKDHLSFTNTSIPTTKQDYNLHDNNNLALKSSTYFNQKRKNSLSMDSQPDFPKSRRLDEIGNLNKCPKFDSSSPLISPENRFKNTSLPQESYNSCKPVSRPLPNFRTASAELRVQQMKKFGNGRERVNENMDDSGQPLKKSLGSRPRPVTSKFIAPMKSNKNEMRYDDNSDGSGPNSQEECDPRLQHIDPKMVEMIRSEIMDCTNPITWDDIAGLQFAKNTIQEIVVWPMLRPDIFTGLRRPPRGILLFGPPGTGKTLIAKCIASQSKSTFFSISASSLTSKWIGDGEKMVRALFAVARVDQPSVIFIDEIDSLLSKRSDTEHESSRRIKTEFLVHLDGATTGEEDRLLIIGATNRPQELDEAARRRLVKRLYIPLPEHKARIEMVTRLMSKERNNLTSDQIRELADLTEGYSGADVKILCQEAALGPIRSISYSQIEHITSEQVRPVTMDDFKTALTRVRSSVSPSDLQCYIDWDKTYGSGSV